MGSFVTQVIASDFQIPYHDSRVLDLLGDFLDKIRPDELHLLGDINDCTAINRFGDIPRDARCRSLCFEFDVAEELLQRLTDRLPNTRIICYQGNHEDRLVRYAKTHLEIYDLLQEVSPFKNWRPYGDLYRSGKLHLTHGDLVRKGSGNTARAMLEKHGVSVIHGHSHRGGSHYRTTHAGVIGAWENFCCCRFDQPYLKSLPDWQHGWSVVYNMQDRFHVVQVPVINYRYVFEHKEFRHEDLAQGTRLTKGLPKAKP